MSTVVSNVKLIHCIVHLHAQRVVMSSYPIGRRAAAFAILHFIFLAGVFSQISDIVSRVNVSQFKPGEPLSIQAELINPASIERIELAYRSFGQSTFKQSEMSITGNAASLLVPFAELTPPFLEYYLLIQKRGGAAVETYPAENAQAHPLKVDLQVPTEPNESVIVLSPEQNERISPEDLYISFSLLRADSTVDRSNIKTSLDGADISASAVVSGDLVVVRPSVPPTAGKHTIRVELFDTQGKSVQSVMWDFTAVPPGGTIEPIAQSMWLYNYSLQAETRNENIQNVTTPYNRMTLSAGARYNQYRFFGNLYATNEEKDMRQPQNRFFIGAESKWLKIGYGDSYPVFTDLVMSGRRVRGLTANLNLGTFHVDVAKGDINRRIESDTMKTFPVDSLAAEQQRDSSGAFGIYDPAANTWAKFSYGSFNRDILIVRPSFGNRDGSHFGLTYLKSTDDMNSIRFGTRPKENLLVGSDLLLLFDNRKIEIAGQVAMSATNNDITGGTFSDSDIDSLYKNDTESRRNNIKQIRDIVGKFITVNQNLIPLNTSNLPTLAYETGLTLNYFDNYLKFTYLRHGNNFESFGQSFVRTDVAGFNIADRLRLANGQVILGGGFERLHDNTASTKAATTTFTTGNFSVGYFPRTDVPNITVAYLLASSLNDRARDSVYGVDDKTNRFFVQLGKEFMLGARHNATLGVSTSTRDDNTPRNLGTKNTSVSFNNVSTFSIPLQTIVSLITVSNSLKLPSAPGTVKDTSINYTTLYLNAQWRLIDEKLRLSGSLSPTFGDIQRTLIDARAQYYFIRNVSLASQFNLYLNKITNNDILWSIILRADM